MPDHLEGAGTTADLWVLTTQPGKSDIDAWRDETPGQVEHTPRNNRVRGLR